MAATIANRHIIHRGKFSLMYAEVTLDSSYASGGESVAAADFGMTQILGMFPAGNTAGYVFECTRSTDISFLIKVYSFSNTTNTVVGQIVTGKDLSAVTIPLLIVGRI